MQIVKPHCNATECRHINTCRQYINAIFISDIICLCGKKLDEQYMTKTQIHSNLLWPTIPSPPQKTWNTWNTKIRQILCKPQSKSDIKDNYRLGQWTLPIKNIHKQWTHVYSPSTSSIYSKKKNGYQTRFTTEVGRRKVSTTTVGEEINKDIPDDCIPIEMKEHNTYEISLHHQYNPTRKKIIRTWHEYIENLPKYEKVMIQNTTIHNMSDLIEHITDDKTIMICSDGALKGKLSGGAWVMAGDKGEIFAIGINPDTAHTDFQTSYRSEIQAGIASILLLVRLCDYF